MENILEKLVNNSKKAFNDGVYDISESYSNSRINLEEIISNSQHAPLITEVKFSSPALGNIRKISDPVEIAVQMVNGGASALSVLTQPFLFDGSPELFIKVRNWYRWINFKRLPKGKPLESLFISNSKLKSSGFIIDTDLSLSNYIKEGSLSL